MRTPLSAGLSRRIIKKIIEKQRVVGRVADDKTLKIHIFNVKKCILFYMCMRNCLLFVLLLNVIVFANDCNIRLLPAFTDSPEKQTLANVRDSLLSALQEQNSSEVFRYVAVLKNSGYGERALDNYELLQIYLLMNQYDSALVTLVREHYRYITDSYVDDESGCCSNVAPYSAFDDKLVDYLNKKIDLTKNANFQKLLERISDGTAKQEYRDFASLMKVILKHTSLRDKHKYCDASHDWNCQEKRDAVQRVRFLGYYTTDDVKDTLFFDSLIEKLIAFQNKYPESEFNPWVMKQVESKKVSREFYFKRRHYYRERFYTGGIGGEYFISPPNGSYEWNVVLQINRIILSLSYGWDDYFSHGWNVMLGVDVFENKFFKVVPLVGGNNALMAGMQFEFRPWISELGREAPIGGYLTINAKYVYKYGAKNDEAYDDEKHSKHRFYLGLGFYIW
ncbi:MAG: hypothetical protein J5534_11820 [Fibrobacter sp.]|nr:hypothetical protein [Fibrobacter sp.]